LTFSQTAARRGINNQPDSKVLTNLKGLAAVLEEVRTHINRPIHITSAYRCAALNMAIGGSSTSAHMNGLAADINCPGMTPKELAEALLKSGIEFDQLILEAPESNGWVHLGLSESKLRNEVLTAKFVNGRAQYQKGLV